MESAGGALPANGIPYCKAHLSAADGKGDLDAVFQIDFTAGSQATPADMAKPLRVKLSRPNGAKFTGSEAVSFVFVQYISNGNGGWQQGETFRYPTYEDNQHGDQVTYLPGEGAFQLDVPAGLPLHNKRQDGQLTSYTYEIAAAVGDDWLKDPLTGQSNFKVDLYKTYDTGGRICAKF